MATTKATNPFYVLLMVAGTAFALTACAYGVMAVKMLDPAQVAQEGDSSRFFVETMDQHGLSVMLVELAVIAVCTFAAIGSDGFWSRRAEARRAETPDSPAAVSNGEERPAASAGSQAE